MSYIHNSNSRPKLDKSILVSILISSDFLQMDALVDICLDNIASRLHEIIKLPIDLSCISDKLVNKLAVLTNPKVFLSCNENDVCNFLISLFYLRFNSNF